MAQSQRSAEAGRENDHVWQEEYMGYETASTEILICSYHNPYSAVAEMLMQSLET